MRALVSLILFAAAVILARKLLEERGRGAAQAYASDGPTRDELYEEAKRLDVPGRSSMTKEELRRAVAERTS